MNDNHQSQDRLVDQQVRGVPVPVDLEQRLSLDVLFSDAAIDRLLASVDAPPDMIPRLHAALVIEKAKQHVPVDRRRPLSTSVGGIDLDRAAEFVIPTSAAVFPANAHANLGSVVSPSIRSRWDQVKWQRTRRFARALANDFGVTAVLLFAVIGTFLGGMELSQRLAAPVVNSGRKSAENNSATDTKSLESKGTRDELLPALPQAQFLKTAQQVAVPADHKQQLAQAQSGSPAELALQERSNAPTTAAESIGPLSVRGAPSPFAIGNAIGQAPVFSGLRFLPTPREPSRAVPRVRGYDLAFEMAHGEAPFVDPSLTAALSIHQPPLSLRTDSFDTLLVSSSFKQRMPAFASLRVEEILAAIPATSKNSARRQQPSETDHSALQVAIAGTRSLRLSPPTDLIEVCITARALDRKANEPLDTVLVLDQSAGPATPLVWQWLCSGLEMASAHMQPADRLTVVVCSEQSWLVAERANAADVKRACSELRKCSPRGAGDFDAAVRIAERCQRSLSERSRLVIIAHADSVERSRDEGQAAFIRWQESLASGGEASRSGEFASSASNSFSNDSMPQFILIDSTRAIDDGSQDDGSQGASLGRIAINPTAIRRAIVEGIYGCSSLVAQRCSLSVTFKAAQVAMYRIVGHRQSVAALLAGGAPESIDMHAGETVRVVYEVAKKPGTGVLASAVVSYCTGNATPQRPVVHATVQASLASDGADFKSVLPSPHACEILLAVSLGELAGDSVHIGSKKRLIDGLVKLSQHWKKRGDVTPFGSQLMDALEQQNILPPSFSSAASK